MKRAVALALGLCAAGILFASCAAKPSVKIVILDPCADESKSFRDAAAYTEFVVYDSRCPPDSTLAAGSTKGSAYKSTVPADENLPDVGDLSKGKYGFAVLMRDSNCGVIGFGCTEADMDSIREVRVAVRAWTTPDSLCAPLSGPGCDADLTCSEGRCVQDDAPSCDLNVVAAGALPQPSTPTARLTGPAIAATPDGYVVAYREQDAVGTTLNAVIAGLSDNGTLKPPSKFNLGGCAGVEMKDGVGIAYAGDEGLVATSLPNCGTGAGAVFIPFDSKGVVGDAQGPKNATFQELTLASGNALAPGAASQDYEFIYRVLLSAPEIQRVVLTTNDTPPSIPPFKSSVPIAQPFGSEDVPFAMVASSPKVRAFMAAVPSKSGVALQVGSGTSDALDVKGEVILPDAAWGALTAWDDKVAAIVPGAAGVSFKAVALGGTSVSEVATGTIGSGAVKGGALATLRDSLFVLTSSVGGLTVHRIAGAQGTLSSSAMADVALPEKLGTVELTGFDGNHVAMAADRSRVAVVWLTKGILAAGDPTGGWALLKCSE